MSLLRAVPPGLHHTVLFQQCECDLAGGARDRTPDAPALQRRS